MSARALGVVALLALVAVAALLVTQSGRRQETQGPAARGRFLPDLERRLDQVAAVRVERGGGELIARVVRGGRGWRVANRWGYAADTETLRATLIGLARARRVAAKSDRASGYDQLGVAPIERAREATLAVTLAGLGDGLTVLIGKEAAGGSNGTYVRRAGSRRAWRVAPALARPDEIADWLDERLVDIPADRIRRVRIEPAAGQPVRVTRPDGPDGPFRLGHPPDRQPLSDSIARSLARIVTGLKLVDVRPLERARDRLHRATARFTTFNGLVVELAAFGQRSDPRGHAVRLRARASAAARPAVSRQAQRLNARWSGWAYTLPEYKWTNATQSLEGVLQ